MCIHIQSRSYNNDHHWQYSLCRKVCFPSVGALKTCNVYGTRICSECVALSRFELMRYMFENNTHGLQIMCIQTTITTVTQLELKQTHTQTRARAKKNGAMAAARRQQQQQQHRRHVKPTEQEKCISGAFHSVNEIYLYSNQHMNMHIAHDPNIETVSFNLFDFILLPLSAYGCVLLHLCRWIRLRVSCVCVPFCLFLSKSSHLSQTATGERERQKKQRIHFHSTRWQWWFWWHFFVQEKEDASIVYVSSMRNIRWIVNIWWKEIECVAWSVLACLFTSLHFKHSVFGTLSKYIHTLFIENTFLPLCC